MLSTKLLSIGQFDFRLNHLLLIGILALAFSISFLLRSQQAQYGFELNEFDPFFNYRATEYILTNGLMSYFEWHDELSWYPDGRNVSYSSQVMLHLTAATTYSMFGGNSSLYDFTILFPAIFGSLTSVVIFALVRVIGGTSAGLFASLFYSISIPILIRGSFGWFKSEPLGLFYSLLAIYLLLSGISSQNKKIAFLKLIAAGIFTTFGLSAWGGNQFFIIPIGIFFIVLPFLRKDHKFLLWAIPLFTIVTIITSFGFERVSSNFIFGLGGLSLIISTLFLVACIFVQSKSSENRKLRNGLLLFLGLLIVGSSVLILDSEGAFLPVPSHRYLNAINPFLTTTDPLVDSVSEHQTTTIEQSFFFHSILMLFAGVGIWILLKKQKTHSSFLKSDMISFALIIGMAGVYTASTFLRLELFASISVIILSSIGVSLLIKEFFNKQLNEKSFISNIVTLSILSGIVILLMVPMFYPSGQEVYAVIKGPPTILNGGTSYLLTTTTDWVDTLEWIKNNTPKDSVVLSWWDYGYWISTLAERTTVADNATLSTTKIQKIAQILLNPPDEASNMLKEIQADYVVTFVAANQLNIQHENQFYTLGGGGDESKKQWFMRIGGFDDQKYLHQDGLNAKEEFWNNTLLGKMFPFTVLAYVDPNNTQNQSPTYVPGMVAIYEKDMKFTNNGDGPLKLVYASDSFHKNQSGPKLIVLVYEVNKDYVPNS